MASMIGQATPPLPAHAPTVGVDRASSHEAETSETIEVEAGTTPGRESVPTRGTSGAAGAETGNSAAPAEPEALRGSFDGSEQTDPAHESDRKQDLGQRIKGVWGRARDIQGKLTAPAEGKLAAVRDSLTTESLKSRRWSFVWACIASWLISPALPVAIWDRMVNLAGQPHLMSGSQPRSFGFMHGSGRWFRDVVAAAWENGHVGTVTLWAAFGLLVPIAAQILPRKWKVLFVVGPFSIYATGVSYADWSLNWTVMGVALLSACAWYGMWAARKRETGFIRFLLLIPIASVVTGICLYSPGAVF